MALFSFSLENRALYRLVNCDDEQNVCSIELTFYDLYDNSQLPFYFHSSQP